MKYGEIENFRMMTLKCWEGKDDVKLTEREVAQILWVNEDIDGWLRN